MGWVGDWFDTGGTHIAFSSSSSIEASDSNCDIFAANRLLTYTIPRPVSASAQFFFSLSPLLSPPP